MKCINKNQLLCLLTIAALFMSGCGNKTKVSCEAPYQLYETSLSCGIGSIKTVSNGMFFSTEKNLGVIDDIDLGLDKVHSGVAEAAGTFNLETGEVTYAQNLYDKMYPASTTKIMTCYVALKYGNLTDVVTVSETAARQPSDASVCHISEGDCLSLEDLLYGLMLASGNDAAIAIAEHISGSEEAFVQLMNEEAAKMGASCTHFENAHGMPSDGHYTSAYDLYVMFKNAVENETFVTIIKAQNHKAVITDKNGKSKELEWNNSNRFLNGKEDKPEGLTVIGGKTGTTQAAGYCLVMLSQNEQAQKIVSVVLKAGCPSDLYLLTREILQEFNN